MSEAGRTAAIEKMRAEGVAEPAIDTFAHYYDQLESGETGLLREGDIEPVDSLPDAEDFPEGDAPLDEVVVLKLNGGLGTSMGMTGPKSLLEAKDGLTFLEIAIRQVQALRERSGADIPFVLMNSFATREASMTAAGGAAEDFVQNKEPKLRADDLAPAEWPDDPGKEWCPPGHGDLYTALLASGMLDDLLGRGVRWAFVSNIDNLGATLDTRILAWLAREQPPFLMEACDRTGADRKGGHLARRPQGGLVLRESAQTADEDAETFQDVSRHRYFNTNNLWVDLHALKATLDERGGVLGLPMMVNRKTVDPSDPGSTPVIQIETAMGAAIDVFDGAQAIRVPRRRFAPAKTTNDLLTLRSDAFALDDRANIELVAGTVPVVDLDKPYKLVPDFEERFPAGPPSLRECRSLTVRGDVTFGAGVVVRGDVTVEGTDRVEDGAVLGP